MTTRVTLRTRKKEGNHCSSDALTKRTRLFRAKTIIGRPGGVTVAQMDKELGVTGRTVMRI